MKLIKEDKNIKIFMLEIEIINIGASTNTYIIQDKKTKTCVIIDPAYNFNKILDGINSICGEIKASIITHLHADHIGALEDLYKYSFSERKKLEVYIHKNDKKELLNNDFNKSEALEMNLNIDYLKMQELKELEDVFKLDNIEFEIIHTPGHSSGSVCLYEKNNNVLFAGDTIFENTYGRTDLPSGSSTQMKETLDTLFERFDDVLVLPGHGEIFNLKDSKRKIRLVYAFKG